MMVNTICRQGHIWKARVKNPKRCPTCSSIYLWALNTLPDTRVENNMFQVSLKTKSGASILHAVLHAWELVAYILKFQVQYPDSTLDIDGSIAFNPSLSGWGQTIGFSSEYGKNDNLPFPENLVDTHSSKDNSLESKPRHEILGRLLINPSELNPVLDPLQSIVVPYRFKHIATNSINDFRTIRTPSTWQLDYVISVPSSLSTSPFLPDTLEMANEHMMELLNKHLSATILFQIDNPNVFHTLPTLEKK